jgi:hypothetical protein
MAGALERCFEVAPWGKANNGAQVVGMLGALMLYRHRPQEMVLSWAVIAVRWLVGRPVVLTPLAPCHVVAVPCCHQAVEGGDWVLHKCLSRLGVPMTPSGGFHRMDSRDPGVSQ